MLVKFYGDLDKYEPIELAVGSLPQILAGVRHVYGQELTDILWQNNHYYLLQKGDDLESIVALHPNMIAADIGEYDTVLVVPDISGEGEWIAVAVIGIAAGSATAAIVGAIINIAISLAISFIIQLLSPTLSFEEDPAQAQKLESSLFNGAPTIREQGGSLPIVVGNCHCGGVLISAGISSEERRL
jgi:predicted phage tail protein